MTVGNRMPGPSALIKRSRPTSPPRRRRSPSPAPAPPADEPTASPSHSSLYHSLFPSGTQLVLSLPLPTLPPPVARPPQHKPAEEEKQQSPERSTRQAREQLLSLSDVPLVQRENLRLAAELQRAQDERDEAVERERAYKEQHGREMREVSSSYQHMQFLFEQAKAQIAQQQHSIDQLRQQLQAKHSHAAASSSSHPSFHLNATLAPAAVPTAAPASTLTSPSDEAVQLAAQLSSTAGRLQLAAQESEALQSAQASLVARLQLAQSELRRAKASRGGWGDYADGLRAAEKEAEQGRLRRDVDWLNEQLQASQQLVAAYEKNSAHRPATAAAKHSADGGDAEKWRARLQQSEQDRGKLRARVEAMEIELFTAEEQRLIHEQKQHDALAAAQRNCEQLTAQLREKEKAVQQLHVDVKAMQAVFDERERAAQSSWMAAHRVNELRDKVQYLTAMKREGEEEAERLKRRLDEATAELIVQSGRHETEVVALRKEALQREEERRAREAGEEEKRRDWHRAQVDNARLRGELDVWAKRGEHWQAELQHYKAKLADTATRNSAHLDDEARVRQQLEAVQAELALLKAELESVRGERVRLVEEGNSLSMLLHAREEEVRELSDRNAVLSGQLAQRDRDDERKREELEVKGEWTREEAERLIQRQRAEVERVKAEMGGVYAKMSELRKEKADMYEMLRVCDAQLVKVQLEFARMESDKAEREMEAAREAELRRRAEEAAGQSKEARAKAEEAVQALTRERDECAVREREAHHTAQLARMEAADKEETIRRVTEEKERKLAELQLCMRREEEATSRYWAKERECRELSAQAGQLRWERERGEREAAEARAEKDKAVRRVEEVETVVRHMDVMSFARDEEVKALMGELDGYRAELMRRVEEASALKESVEAGKEEAEAGRRRERELEARLKEAERELERRRDELAVAARQYEALQQTDGVYRQLVEQLQADVRALTEEQTERARDMEAQEQQLACAQQLAQQLSLELSVCRSEGGALMADLKLLLQENGIVQAKLGAAHERDAQHAQHDDAHRHAVEQLTASLAQHEAVIHALQREVRAAKLDVDRLNLAAAETADRLVHARQREKAAEADVVRLELDAAKREDVYRQLCGEVDGWKRQNEELVRCVERLRGELTQQADEQQTARRELVNVKQLAQLTEAARVDSQRAAAEQLSQLSGLRAEKERVEREREAGRAECEGLRVRVHHMELLATSLRREAQTAQRDYELALENKAKAAAELAAAAQRMQAELEEKGREADRLRAEKEQLLGAMRGGAGGLQEECARLTRRAEALEEDKRRLKGYLLRYEREVKRLEAERGKDGRAAGGGSPGGGSGASGVGGGNDAVEAVRKRVEGKEREEKRDAR